VSAGRGWSRHRRRENSRNESKETASEHGSTESGEYSVTFWHPDPADDFDSDAVTRWHREITDHPESPESLPQGNPDPPALIEPPTSPPSAAEVEELSDSPSPSPVSEVVGIVRFPQIVVGRASPVVEPNVTGEEFQSFPFRADTVIDGWSTKAITVRAASLRGHFHRYNGAPRQDDFAVHELADGRVIALVADGVSQALQSHLGATAAVRAAAHWLTTNAPPVTEEIDWLGMVKDTAWALAEQARVVFSLPEPDPSVALQKLSTTLVCAVIEPNGPEGLKACLMGVGDSGAWIVREGEFVPLLGGKAEGEGGISSSAVAGLPRVPNELKPAIVEFEVGDVLLLGTDGIGDPLGTGHGGVGNLFRDLFAGPEPPSMIEFAHAVDFSRETFDDDRTLVAVMPRNAAHSSQ
jgi:hypothetical protein